MCFIKAQIEVYFLKSSLYLLGRQTSYIKCYKFIPDLAFVIIYRGIILLDFN